MNVPVIGASQGTGALTVRAALDRGHRVTAFARSPQKLVLDNPQLSRVVGDFHKRASLEAALPGHDAVVVTASATGLKGLKENPRYLSQGTGCTIDAMKKAGVKRLVVLSAIGTGESLTAALREADQRRAVAQRDLSRRCGRLHGRGLRGVRLGRARRAARGLINQAPTSCAPP